MGLAERCKIPQWGLGRSRSRQTIWCILESTSAALVAAVFVDFPKNKCNFLHKNELDIVRRVQFRRPMRSFSRGTVATIAVRKSAPTINSMPCAHLAGQCGVAPRDRAKLPLRYDTIRETSLACARKLTYMGPNQINPQVSNKCIAVRKVATPLRELTCHMKSHSVTCHPAEVTFPPLPQPKLVLE